MTNRKTKIAGAGLITAVLGCGLLKTLHAAPPPPPHQRIEDTLATLDLSADQKQKADAAIADYQAKQRQLHDDLLQKLSGILTPDQMQQFQAAANQPPAPRGANNPPDGGAPSATVVKNAAKGTVIFTGGYDTDPRDHGRPIVLIAAALGVPDEVFRTAFSGVTPARGGEEPQDEQVRKNKAALLKVLEPHGVTNDRLDEVSNYYRYSSSRGQMWKNKPAAATAVITDGKVTEIKITDAGAGYSSPPKVSVVGYDDVKAIVELSYGKDLATNGSIKSIKLDSQKK